jgi:hypothetical protein
LFHIAGLLWSRREHPRVQVTIMSLIALLNAGVCHIGSESYYRLSAPANSSSNDVFSFAAIA